MLDYVSAKKTLSDRFIPSRQPQKACTRAHEQSTDLVP